MTHHSLIWHTLISLAVFAAVYVFVRHAWASVRAGVAWQEARYDRVLNHQLLLDIPPRAAVLIAGCMVLVPGLIGYLILDSLLALVVGMAFGLLIPALLVRHLEQKRRERLESQLVDGITTLASGVRAGLNLVQSFELLFKNSVGPLQQEFGQLLREYQMGLDLYQAMRNAANRIGSSNYRLLFTAIEMHRRRGGDTSESLDRIAESIREIQRLEGKLDSLTAQGRMQAWMMAAMPIAILAVYYMIEPDAVATLFIEPIGRLLLLGAAAFIVIGFYWIRRIMAVDI